MTMVKASGKGTIEENGGWFVKEWQVEDFPNVFRSMNREPMDVSIVVGVLVLELSEWPW